MDLEHFESTRLDDLVQHPPRASERSAWIRVGVSFAAVVLLVLTAAIAPSGQRLRLARESIPVSGAIALPPVAARPTESLPPNVEPIAPTAPAAIAPVPVPVPDLQASDPGEIEAAVQAEIGAEVETWSDEPADETPPTIDSDVVAAAPHERADRVISPSLGDPAEMRIERSVRDQEREQRAATRAAIADSLDAARRARSEGRLKDADAGYAEVAQIAPDDWAALIEWSNLLVELERPGDALALVEDARTRAPRDQGLLIAQARLLEAKGDRAHAIELLEQSGLALTEAPNLHALTAAYHQRAGDHATAIERYEEILRRFPEESRAWMGLGISLEAVGRRREARDVYRISLQVGELPGGTRRWVTTRLVALGEED